MRYNKKQFYFLLLLFFTIVLLPNAFLAQTLPKQESLFDESENLLYSKPNDALKVGFHLLKNSSSNSEKAKLRLLIAQIYKVKGDYSNSLHHLFKADKNTADLPAALTIEILVKKADILRELYLDDQAKKYLAQAEKKALLLKDRNEKEYVTSLIIMEKARICFERQNYKDALKLIQQQNADPEKMQQKHFELTLKYKIIQGRIYSGLGEFDKAQNYFESASLALSKLDRKFDYADIYSLSGLATVCFHKKDHHKAIALLLTALKKAQLLGNLYLEEMVTNQLVANYIALNDRTNYKIYHSAFLATSKKLEDIEQESVNTAYNLIAQESVNSFEAERQSYYEKMFMVLAAFLLVVIVCFVFWFRCHSKKKRLNEIINYLEITRSNLLTRFTEKKETGGKKIFIPQETEQILLAKLKKFEGSTRFTSNDMSLALLAGQFETNTKYLSEVINKNYNVNFNTYINKLRINFIVEKLKSDPNFMNYKISYLAEACGFSSHSSFATIFKSITGIAPITFIELLREENETTNHKTAS
nr:helix-turn-helix domain-containing protein [uncultured Flavobacterium sp.]